MWVIGLTGSIGMGKSTAAAMVQRMGAVVCDSDAVVHRLFQRGGTAVPIIATRYPDAIREGAVDRRVLGAKVLGNAEALKWLERVIHPLVAAAQRRFLKNAARRRVAIAILDIPLLYETGAEKWLDGVMVVSAPLAVQRRRVLARSGMTNEKLTAILARQMPDGEKRRRADFVIPTGLGRALTRSCLSAALRAVRSHPPRSWKPGWRCGQY